jgi:hypothetical protein
MTDNNIKRFRLMTDEEMVEQGWEGMSPPIAIELGDGTLIIPSSDEEGNGPGALFGYKKGEGSWMFLPKQ